MTKISLIAAAVLCMAVALAPACGGDDDNNGDTNGNGTPQVTTAASSPQPVTSRTPAPVSTAGSIDSTDLGYTADVPQGWTAQAPPSPEGSLFDLFVGPSGQGLPPTILVRCDEGGTAGDVEAAVTATARIDPQARVAAPVTVSGNAATVVEYAAGSEMLTLRVDKRDVRFIDDRCLWTISLSVAAGRIAEFDSVFNAFLESFTVTG